MADYTATPQVQDANQILLYGNYFRIKGPVEVQMGTQMPPKYVIGDYGKDDQPILSTYSVSNLSGGMGVWRYDVDHPEFTRYWNGQNFDGFWSGAWTIGPLLTTVEDPTGNGAAFRSMGIYSNLLVVVYPTLSANTGDLYTFTTVFGALVGTTTQVAWGAPVEFNNKLFIPTSNARGGGAGYSYYDGAITNVASPNMVTFTIWDGKLYGVDSNGVLYSYTTGASGSWLTRAKLLGISTSNTYRYIHLSTFDDGSGNNALWAITHSGAFIYDADLDTWRVSYFNYPRSDNYYLGSVYGRSVGLHRNHMYIVTGLESIVDVSTLNTSIANVDDISVNVPDGLSNDYHVNASSSITDIITGGRFVFLSYYGSAAKNAILARSNCEGTTGWHPIIYLTTTNTMLLQATGYTTYTGSTLYISNADGISYTSTNNLEQSPLYTTVRTYATSGFVELPIFDGGFESQNKLAVACRIKLASSPTAASVSVGYRINGSTGAYTTFTSTVTGTSEVTIRFPEGGSSTGYVGLAFKSIQFKITLTRGTATTASPIVEYFAMDFIRLPEVRRMFVVNIDTSMAIGGKTPQQQRELIWTMIGTTTLGTFAYLDDASGTRSFLVKALSPQGLETSGYQRDGIYRLNLIELTDNTGA